jgi:hypothetical protein
MALEIPNAIVAAGVMSADFAASPVYTLDSSNGLLSSENLVAFGGPFLAMQLETPVTAKEGCLLVQSLLFGFDPALGQVFLTGLIKDGPVGDPVYDALPDNSLCLGVGNNSPTTKTRGSFTVLHLPRPAD